MKSMDIIDTTVWCLFLIFMVLKSMGLSDMSWWYVTMPLYSGFVFGIVWNIVKIIIKEPEGARLRRCFFKMRD